MNSNEVSRLARSTCCQRSVVSPHWAATSDDGDTNPLIRDAVLETFQTYYAFPRAVNPSTSAVNREHQALDARFSTTETQSHRGFSDPEFSVSLCLCGELISTRSTRAICRSGLPAYCVFSAQRHRSVSNSLKILFWGFRDSITPASAKPARAGGPIAR